MTPAPAYWPYHEHRTMAEVMEVEARIQRERENDRARLQRWRKQRVTK